ncbi:helix-turn-helix transcriptional regulator [Ligilactobacillus murinus]|uniref:helix-turn-helix domain-containing protein n=1 Tax=Ligilactobacillus murinus TaxID=1622 RepID=UPI00214B910F|nr:helix-turn-helix transcriptional regulator [Ligilactobacillus murinus]MCR1897208.1 helix-turn-helix transcriptional regulator [Ligilactobacillus murinus]
MSNRIRELRNEQNLTLKELGEKVGLAPNTISQYETGDREPKLKTWIKLADFFDVPVSYLQGLDDSRDVNQISFFKISSYDDALEKCLSKKERDELSDIENKIIKVYISRKMDFNTRDELKYDLEKIIEKYIDKTDVKSTDLENFASNLKENYNQDKQ